MAHRYSHSGKRTLAAMTWTLIVPEIGKGYSGEVVTRPQDGPLLIQPDGDDLQLIERTSASHTPAEGRALLDGQQYEPFRVPANEIWAYSALGCDVWVGW
jgi:hypothetical protein